MKLLCAVVRGITERKDKFVLELQMIKELDSVLNNIEEIAKDKCAGIVNRRTVYWDAAETVTVLELRHNPCVAP